MRGRNVEEKDWAHSDDGGILCPYRRFMDRKYVSFLSSLTDLFLGSVWPL